MFGVTLREIAEIHGISLGRVRSFSTQNVDWPDPVGSRKEPRRRGAHAYVYDPAAIDQWMRSSRLGNDQWTMDRIAAEFEVTIQVVLAARKGGHLGRPDGHQKRRPWWRPSTAQSWWTSRQVPDGAWVLAQVGENIGLRYPEKRHDFPPGDGMAVTTRWWWTTTITTWWEPVAEQRAEQRKARIAAQEAAASRDANRWFGRDVAAHTGLSYESVRTYRRLGKLPDPDGMQNLRPWWSPETIRAWDRPRATGRPRQARQRDADRIDSHSTAEPSLPRRSQRARPPGTARS